VNGQARAARIHAGVLELILKKPDASLGFDQPGPHVLALSVLLRQLKLRTLTIAGVGPLDQDFSPPAGQSQVFGGLFELVGSPAQLVAGDEAFVEQRFQRVVLFLKPRDLLLGKLQPGSRFLYRERAFALSERIDGGLSLLTFDFGHLKIDLRLPPFLNRSLELTLQVGRVNPDEEVAFIDARTLGDKENDLSLTSAKR
jgi:hypothetical protein